jgi:hypothetical protein
MQHNSNGIIQTNITNPNYDSTVNKLIDRYYELVEKAGLILFSWWTIKYIQLPSLHGMPKWRSRFYDIVSPTIIFDPSSPPSFWKLLIITLWVFVLTLWTEILSLFVLLVKDALPQTAEAGPSFLVELWIYLMIFIPIAIIYSYTSWYLTVKDNPTKLYWLISLIVMFLLFWFDKLPLSKADFLSLYNNPIFSFAIIFLIIPSILLSSFLLLFLSKLVLEIIFNILRSLFRAHQSLSIFVLRALSTEYVGSEDSRWKLSDLRTNEIQTLRELSKTNLEATEKKTIPAIILLTLLGFLATTTPVFGNVIGNSFQWIFNHMTLFVPSGIITFNTIGNMLVNFIVTSLFLYIVLAYLVLFRNLIIQGIVVQACIIAEFGRSQIQEEPFEMKRCWLCSFLRRLFLLLFDK